MGPTDMADPCAELNAAGLTPQATAYVFHIAFSLLLARAAISAYSQLGIFTSLSFLVVAAAVIVLQVGFSDVVREAQACASVGHAVAWTDESSVWLFNAPFALIWAGAASWGILAFTAPSADGPFTLSLPPVLGSSSVARVLCFLPSLGSIYAAVFLVGGGALIKPLGSKLYWFEPVLAATLTLSGFTWLMVALGGGRLIKIKTWSKIPFSRAIALLIGVSAAYYCVWRLNGGLVLSAEQWAVDSPLRQAFEAGNPAKKHSWQHLGFLRDAARSVGVPFLIPSHNKI